MLKLFIERPVLSTVISIMLVFLGIIGLNTLPVEQYPDVAPPTVVVTANYPGANASVVLNSVIIPLEEQINGVEGMMYMESTAMNNGQGQIMIYFNQGVNPDIAAVNVQNLAARANPLLPSEVIQQGVTVQKQQNSTILGFTISSENPNFNARFIQNYANINIIPQLKRVGGVGNAQVFGAQDYSMRIWLKPDLMASYGISVDEIIAALNDQSIEAAPGELGANSNQTFQYSLKYSGKYQTPEQFQDIIVRSTDGHVLKLGNVAEVELGSLNYTVRSNLSPISKKDPNAPFIHEEAVFCSVSQIAGSNADQVIKDVKKVLNEAEINMPNGIKITYILDASLFLNESIKKVKSTLFEAFILVFIVVYIFLQDMRSTIIPAIAIPVSIVGTFFIMKLLGFSVNMITLFALVLAIGIVVDDAIVVVEAVHAQLESGIKDPKQATLLAMQEIAPAIISITLVMSAVFIPVSFLSGTTGIFFRQFGLTLASAIVISALNALTLSPALCALFLRPMHGHDESGKKKSFIDRFFYSFNILFNAATNKYKNALHFLGKGARRLIVIGIIAVAGLIYVGLSKIIPTDFVPNEDSGTVMGFITLAPGTSLELTDELVNKVVDIAEKNIPDAEFVVNINGYNFMTGIGSSYASIFIKMKPWKDRPKVSSNDVVAKMNELTKDIKEAQFFFTVSPTLQGFGLSSGVNLQLQDRTGGDIRTFYNVTKNFVDSLRQKEQVMIAMTNFSMDFPQIEITADIPKIKAAGLTLQQVMMTVQTYIGSYYVNTFNLYGKQFRIMAQASPDYRRNLDDLNNMFVRTPSGDMAPITEFLSFERVNGPQTLSRFNMYNTMDIMIIPNYAKQYNTGDIYGLVESMKGQLGSEYTYEYAGMSREGASSGGQTTIIFGICLIFVYLLLSALYESYLLPFSVLFSLPIGIAGVYIFLFAFGLSQGIVDNIYVQISLVMLIGLLAKNAILIVEYAVQRRQQGMSIVEAAVNGAVARLRPILMTSLAFIAGVFPLVVATGAGAVGNRSLGLATVGGMFIGTFIGVLVIPTLYIIFQVIQEKFSGPVIKDTEAQGIIK